MHFLMTANSPLTYNVTSLFVVRGRAVLASFFAMAHVTAAAYVYNVFGLRNYHSGNFLRLVDHVFAVFAIEILGNFLFSN